VASWGERLTRISAEITNVKRVVVEVETVCSPACHDLLHPSASVP